jgi:V8-like Glu-specific endopeptidase
MRKKNATAASAVGLCLLVPLAFGCWKQRPSDETVVSDTLRFKGRVVEELSSGEVIREIAFVRGKEFRWQAKVGNRAGTPEIEKDVPSKPLDLNTISVEELAESLRGLALYRGHQFLEVRPPFELARLVKEHYQLQQQGAPEAELERVLRSVAAEQGSAAPTARFEEVERAVAGSGQKESTPEIVHGTDDREVFDNTAYPHRAQIVFDNTDTSSIDGSEGSGSLIGSSTAMSVAHVFWDEANDTWEADHLWAPGFDSEDADPSPWGAWFGCYWVTIPLAYTSTENQNTWDFAVVDFNVGCNSVDKGVNSDQPGNTVGWLGHYTASEDDIEAWTGYVRGYPGVGTCGNSGEECNVQVWGDISDGSENVVISNEIHHQADSSGGQSGSGFYHYVDPSCGGCGPGPYLVGVHRAGASSSNRARRYDSTVLAFVQAYSSEF